MAVNTQKAYLMVKTKKEKNKAKRKVKQRQRRSAQSYILQKEKAAYLYYCSLDSKAKGNLDEALKFIKKAVRLDPDNEDFNYELAYLGQRTKRYDLELKAFLALYNKDILEDEEFPVLCELLVLNGQHDKALAIVNETLLLISGMAISNKRQIRARMNQIKKDCLLDSKLKKAPSQKTLQKPVTVASVKTADFRTSVKEEYPDDIPDKSNQPVLLPKIDLTFDMDTQLFADALLKVEPASVDDYELALEGYSIRFKESFNNLICLNTLNNIRSFWYQEETAKKVLKSFRGRALLADEVGLGKTIEALIILKEYIQRGMVKSCLILTPTPLVSQWKEELNTKFGFNIPSTDDHDYRIKGEAFWEEPFILASINHAKSKNNFKIVTDREYDMVIVDEAHHLKNKNTLNWKLVNSLKKRFLLLLTATPVENNLMELFNLITLLKPGQLKTASSFREEFMTRGDPTDPQNREKLKELLGQVMIRNTRALARVNIPSRFAETIRINADKHELELYERITELVKSINKTSGAGNKMLLKNLLAEAGSSPRAVSNTLMKIINKKDLLLKHETKIRATINLCRSMNDTRKNKILLKLIKSKPDKTIIFVKFLGTMEHLSDFLSWKQVPHALFHGGMNNQKKDEQIKSFMTDKDLLVTTEIGGEGRNLQFCHQMINYDLPWNPMKIEQRIGRIHRIGQEKEVMIYNLCSAGSVEDYILEILDKKINMFEMVIGEIDMILGRIRGEQEFSEMVYDIWMQAVSEEERKKSFDQLANRLKRNKSSYLKTKKFDEKLFGENYEL